MPGKTFARAPDTIMSRIRQLAAEFHMDDMQIAGEEGSKPINVSVEAYLVHGPRNADGDQTGPALQVHGCQAAACVRASKLEERVAGRCDVIIQIDGDRYKEWPVATLNAILDHELQHIQLERHAATSVPILDDIGRPKIKMRLHDHDYGWFDVIAQRHGSAAIEVCQASAFATEELRQLYFPDLMPHTTALAEDGDSRRSACPQADTEDDPPATSVREKTILTIAVPKKQRRKA